MFFETQRLQYKYAGDTHAHLNDSHITNCLQPSFTVITSSSHMGALNFHPCCSLTFIFIFSVVHYFSVHMSVWLSICLSFWPSFPSPSIHLSRLLSGCEASECINMFWIQAQSSVCRHTAKCVSRVHALSGAVSKHSEFKLSLWPSCSNADLSGIVLRGKFNSLRVYILKFPPSFSFQLCKRRIKRKHVAVKRDHVMYRQTRPATINQINHNRFIIEVVVH